MEHEGLVLIKMAFINLFKGLWRLIRETDYRQWDSKKFFEVITFTVAITGALVAIDTFTAKGSMNCPGPTIFPTVGPSIFPTYFRLEAFCNISVL